MSLAPVPDAVRNKALAVGAGDWLDNLPQLIAELEREWSISVGRPYDGGTEAFVARATLDDGAPAVLKLVIPRSGNHAGNEITVLRLVDGDGCPRLLRDDPEHGALLMERLGPSLSERDIPIEERHEILCAAAATIWRPAPGAGLPTGADKGRWLAAFIERTWQELDRPCTERAIEEALAAAESRIAAHDDERAVLVHGDVHQWNALEAAGDYHLIDPDGLLAEAEYDMGILMREDPEDLLAGDAHERARRLAHRTGLDATAIWEWGVIERVSTGLLCTSIDLQPVGQHMLEVADLVAHLPPFQA